MPRRYVTVLTVVTAVYFAVVLLVPNTTVRPQESSEPLSQSEREWLEQHPTGTTLEFGKLNGQYVLLRQGRSVHFVRAEAIDHVQYNLDTRQLFVIAGDAKVRADVESLTYVIEKLHE